jgi:hypothetical protein
MKNKKIKSYDCDGVISLDEYGVGIRPSSIDDVIITGRSFEESDSTLKWLKKHNIHNKIFFNDKKFIDKTRINSGRHKANIINKLNSEGYEVVIHYEDDQVQAEQIKLFSKNVKVIMVNHDNLIEMENVRR